MEKLDGWLKKICFITWKSYCSWFWMYLIRCNRCSLCMYWEVATKFSSKRCQFWSISKLCFYKHELFCQHIAKCKECLWGTLFVNYTLFVKHLFFATLNKNKMNQIKYNLLNFKSFSEDIVVNFFMQYWKKLLWI